MYIYCASDFCPKTGKIIFFHITHSKHILNIVFEPCETDKSRVTPALTFDFMNADDFCSCEGSIAWLLNCSIRRLFTCEEVSLHSSGSLLIFSENHAFKLLKYRKGTTHWIGHTGKTVSLDIENKQRKVKKKDTTMRNMVCQVPTSLDGGCFIKHVRKILLILRHSIP